MPRPQADEDAKEAIALLLRGDVEAGIDLYRKCFKVDRLPHTPVGVHLLFLERAGQMEAMARLLELAIAQGASVAVRAGALGAEPSEAAAEYEGLFARGIINSRMIFEYLRILAALGRSEELRRILDVDRLLRSVQLDLPADIGATGNLAAAVAALLEELKLQSKRRISGRAVRQMTMLKKFSALQHPAAKTLMDALSMEVAIYLADWSSSDHPFANLVASGFEIEAWGLISQEAGYVTPHIHAKGWATGVYYPTGVYPGE